MDKRDLNRNQNYRRNNIRNDDGLKKEMKEKINELKESFVKDKEEKISHTVPKDVPNNTMKLLIVCDSSYQN